MAARVHTWPGLDLLDCFYGWYKSPTSTYTDGWSSESTSSLNAIDFLQGVSDQHVKNGGEVFGNSPALTPSWPQSKLPASPICLPAVGHI